ncbi:MAG: hypothetical protein IKU42_07485 [Oscillospiraceae bacterium]|nr:hypothetical protein [Oscillospiraceae bacterium]
MKYKKAMTIILVAIIVLAVGLIAALLIYFGGGETTKIYTWEKFEALSPEEQMEFKNSFRNEKAFEKWLDEVQSTDIYLPWENGGKKPKDYTWEEFEALTAEQQIAFQNSFKKFEKFEKWMEEATEIKVNLPWENDNKKPEEYTWEEFEALTAEQQMAFQNSFKNFEEFDKWLKKVNPEEIKIEENPSVNWTKPINEYTWEEFEAMTSEEQIVFQNSFESFEDFEEWMNNATLDVEENVSFEKEELFSVTWEEFEAMTGEEQMIFQNSFDSIEEFDKWLQANEPK